MTRRSRRVVVIGAGIAGLATAALLARDGHDVELVERGEQVGGRTGTWERDGFRFDTGPSWYLMPEVFDHLFELLGTSAAAELDLVRLDPGYRVFFEGREEPVDIAADRATNVATFERIEPGAGRRLEAYLDSAKEAYTLALRHFLYTSFDRPARLLHRAVLRRAPRLAMLLLRSLEQHVAGQFSDVRLRQVLGYPAVFLGTSPDRAPSMYHLMSSMDLDDGVLYPQGGLTEIIAALERLALAEGVRLRTRTEVVTVTTDQPATRVPAAPLKRLLRRPHARVTGVRCVHADGTTIELAADLVVGAGDLHHLETQLLSPDLRTYPEEWWTTRDPGPGAVLAYLGVSGSLPQLEHHSLFFTADWRTGFEAIYGDDPHVPDPASIYVCRPSATDPSVAPADHENLFVLVPVPADVSIGRGGVDGSGDATVEQTVDAAIAQVAAWAGIDDLASRVVVRRSVGPGDFATDLHAWSGGALGPAHTLRQSAFFRGRNASRHVDGLLYAGASTIPGVGLPMCLISAELVLKRVRGDRSSGPVTT